MTISVEEIRARIKDIDGLNDNEDSHFEEDRLYLDVLRAIATCSRGKASELAAEALKCSELTFTRWYA